MRVISKKALREFWEGRKGDHVEAEKYLDEWYRTAKSTDVAWNNFAELKGTFPSADQVGSCTVFDDGGNRFRLIGRVKYATKAVYILAVMDHKEYDRRPWVDDCGSYSPPPKRKENR